MAHLLATQATLSRRARLIIALLIFLTGFAVRSLQAVDLAPVMYTTNQPFNGLVTTYDLRAVSILAGDGLLGPYDVQPSETKWLSEAPGYGIYLSAIYRITGRDFFKVQVVQNLLNSLSPVLLFLIAGRLLSWRVGIVAGFIAALSHHLSHFSNFILPDSLCVLPLLAAFYVLLLARQSRHAYWLYALAGVLCGIAAWLRPQPMLLGPFLAVMLTIIRKPRRLMLQRAAVTAGVALLIIAPITIRNYLVYKAFVPISIGTGLNLWEGIGEASGDRFGAVAKDGEVAEQEARLYNEPRYGGVWSTPDGISRDHDRVSKSLVIIRQHPIWYTGVVLGRMKEMFHYAANAPLVFRMGQTGAARDETLIRREWQDVTINESGLAIGKRLFWLRPVARAFQRIVKETILPMIFLGVIGFFILSWRRALFIAIVPLYYLIFQSMLHTEFRYTLPMQHFLFVFAAVAWVAIGSGLWQLISPMIKRLHSKRQKSVA